MLNNQELKGKKVLVTGATGLIGSELTKKLLSEGAEVFAVGRSLEKLNRVFPNIKELTLIATDISKNYPQIDCKVDYIFNAAGPISGKDITDTPVDTILCNINSTINCLEMLKRQGCGRLIIFSSATVYGNNQTVDIVNEKMTEKAETIDSPKSSYSESKRMIEVIANAYNKQYGVDVCSARIAYVFGYSYYLPQTAIFDFIRRAVEGQDIVIKSDLFYKRDNIFLDDVINGLLFVANNGEASKAYNISSKGEKGNYLAVNEIAETIANIVNTDSRKKIRVIYEKEKVEILPGMKMDNEALKTLGWELSYDIESGLRKCVNYFICKEKSK